MTPSEAFEWIHQFLKEIDTQDTRATAQPIQFLLQRKYKYVAHDDYNSQTEDVYTHSEMEGGPCESMEDAIQWLKDCGYEGDNLKKATKEIIHLKMGHCWKTDQAFFTEKGYERHLTQNRHNLGAAKDRRTYVVHAFRNPEMVELFKALRAIDAMRNKIKYTEIIELFKELRAIDAMRNKIKYTEISQELL